MDILSQLAKMEPESPAVISNGEALTYRRLLDLMRDFRERLEAVGRSQVALHLRQDGRSIALLLSTVGTGSRYLLIPDYYPEGRSQELLSTYGVDVHADPDGEWTACSPGSGSSPPECTEICILTSGTTGAPKCVKHTWESLAGDVKFTDRFSGRRWFLGYPITHFAGLQVFLQCLLNGGTLLLSADSDPRSCYALLEHHKPSYLNCTPTLMRQVLMQYRPEHFEPIPLRTITLGGEVVDQATIDLIKSYLPDARVVHVYASSELGAILHVGDEREGFPADLVDETRMKIVNGELRLKKTSRSMRGYLGDPTSGDEEWIATRDLVEVRDGRVVFCGRIDDVINVGGYKVHPVLVENTIRQIPGIQDVVVTGERNALVGNLVKALLRVSEEDRGNGLIRNVVSHCNENLPYYMVPRLFDFVDHIETSKTQKKVR